MIIDIKRKSPSDNALGSRFVAYTDGFGSQDDVFHVEFDPDVEKLTEVIVRTVAVIEDKSALDLKPLGEVIDTDNLESIVDDGSKGIISGGRFSFTYEGFKITVDTDGHLWFERLSASTDD